MKNLPKISIVIPALKNSPSLQKLLRQIQRQDIYEVMIVQSAQTPSGIDPSLDYTLLSAAQGRGPQIQAGLDAARGDYIWILHADSVLPPNAPALIREVLANPHNAMGCFPLAFNVSHNALKLYAWMSRFESLMTTFGDQGYFFRAAALKGIPDLAQYPLLEDVILRQQLKKRGKIVKLDQYIQTDAKRFLAQGMWRTQWNNGWILYRFLRGASPQKLYDEYYQKQARANGGAAFSFQAFAGIFSRIFFGEDSQKVSQASRNRGDTFDRDGSAFHN